MKELSEKDSLNLLERGGFEVVERIFFLTRFGLKNSLRKVGIDSIMKVSGRNLPSKTSEKLVSNLKTYTGALIDFKHLKKCKGFRGIILKKKINGKEFFVLVKRNSSSKPSLTFGYLGTNEENQKGISFKLFPINKKKLNKMVKEVKFPKTISSRSKKNFEEFVLKLCKFINENSHIQEIEIDPLFVNEKSSIIVNSKIKLE
ncbi:hypothetical protein GW932_03755 [archaeon]|nr:hypothetical protein [archaeon]PJC45703.1 MAG: hypothetical protein CO037_00115 [Candidatus Pacearchaeota archaeon CG_4_9_14_0_2_um_filter_30_8]